MYTLLQYKVCADPRLFPWQFLVQKVCVGWECALQVFLVFREGGEKCCQIPAPCPLCKMLRRRLLNPLCCSLLVCCGVTCSAPLWWMSKGGEWDSKRTLDSGGLSPSPLCRCSLWLPNKPGTSLCGLQPTWNPLLLAKGLVLQSMWLGLVTWSFSTESPSGIENLTGNGVTQCMAFLSCANSQDVILLYVRT